MSDIGVIATVVSALILALGSLVVAIISAVTSRRNDARSAHRSILEPWLTNLGEDIGGVIATANVYFTRVKKGQDLGAWRTRMEAHAEGLERVRRRAKYPLFGIDEPIRDLGRVSSWIQHCHQHIDLGDELLSTAEKLRSKLDRVIAKSYRRGEPPTWNDRRHLANLAGEVRARWDERIAPER